MSKISGGVFYVTVQNFYPTSRWEGSTSFLLHLQHISTHPLTHTTPKGKFVPLVSVRLVKVSNGHFNYLYILVTNSWSSLRWLSVLLCQFLYFRPFSESGECKTCATFARYVYTLTLGVLALVCLLIVLFFQKSTTAPKRELRGDKTCQEIHFWPVPNVAILSPRS